MPSPPSSSPGAPADGQEECAVCAARAPVMSGLCAGTARRPAGDSWFSADDHNNYDNDQNKNDNDANNDYDDDHELQR